MDVEDQEKRRLSRRELLRRAGLGGLTVATAGMLATLPEPVFAGSAWDESPEGFLAWAYAQRARAMSTGDQSLLTPLYDPASAHLLAFEQERAVYFHGGLAALWDCVVLDYLSHVSLVDLTVSGSTATVKLDERITVRWIPSPRPVPRLPAAIAAQRQREPARFQSTMPVGPSGEVTSLLGVRHEVTLSKGSGGWRLAADAYDRCLFAPSPDLKASSWAAVTGPGPLSSPAQSHVPEPAVPSASMATCTMNWRAVQNYAQRWCAARNTGYCNYSTCGGDCTDFVSQCLSAGGARWDWTWKCSPGPCACCCPSYAWAGTFAWVNTEGLHGWLLRTRRGWDVSSIYYLGIGDLVTYDWTGDGIWDHMCIVSNVDPRGVPVVSCHSIDKCNTPWKDGGAARYRYTQVSTTYGC